MSLTDSLIGFTTIIFVMSTISERVANFLKLYFQDKIIYIPVVPHRAGGKWIFFMKARISILAQSQITQAAEKEREYRVLVINIIVGILSAAFINLNIFEVLEYVGDTDTPLNIGWTLTDLRQSRIIFGFVYLFLFIWSGSLILFSKLPEQKRNISKKYVYTPFFVWLTFTVTLLIASAAGHVGEKQILLHFTGYVSVGVFLSLGSKFWHDLLDILFSFKRTQEKLTDRKLITDFDSADQIIKYTEISQYNIAEQLYDKYRPELWKIDGVVSCGLVTYFNERVKLYQKRIEVEFTNNEAQQQLFKLREEGEVQINYNNFLLKDYFEMKFTKDIIALPDTGIDSHPICFARNTSSSNINIKGSFNVKKTLQGEFIAFGCLHVFASDSDFNKFKTNRPGGNLIIEKEVEFNINGALFKGQIIPDSVIFGDRHFYGADYCECSVTENLYKTYMRFIKQFDLTLFPERQMKMFGATSKDIFLFEVKGEAIPTRVNYGQGFQPEYRLFKIDPVGTNVNPGDSGSSVYFKKNGSKDIEIGIIIAKSDDSAYMFKLSNLLN